MIARLLLLTILAGFGLACGGGPPDDDTLAQLAELERRLEEGRTLEKRLPAMEREIQNLDSQVEDLDAILVADEADALVRLRTALERSGFGVVDLRGRGEASMGGVSVLLVDVEAVTPFESATRAFEALTMQPLLVIVDDLSMKRDGDLFRHAFTARLGLAPPRL